MRPRDPPPPPPPGQPKLSRSASNGKLIYDIAETSETTETTTDNGLVILHTNAYRRNSAPPNKPPRSKRSQSFTPASKSTEHLNSPRAKSIESDFDVENRSLVVVGKFCLKIA